jgi:hypothetical protein
VARTSISLALLFVLFGAALEARATVLEALSVETLAERADAVVWARVGPSASRMANRGGHLVAVTVTRLNVREWLKGEGGATLSVVERGGAHPGGRTVVVGAPRYEPGEEVIVFLARDAGSYRTLGMTQGRFEVIDADTPEGAKVRRDPRGATLVHRDGARAGGFEVIPRDIFLARVRAAIERGGR